MSFVFVFYGFMLFNCIVYFKFKFISQYNHIYILKFMDLINMQLSILICYLVLLYFARNLIVESHEIRDSLFEIQQKCAEYCDVQCTMCIIVKLLIN